MSSGLSIFLSAGDASGDQHAAALVRSLHVRHPQLAIHALSGSATEAAGARLLFPLAEDPIMGFRRVVGSLSHFLRLLSRTERWLAKHRPQVVVLVDYPGFNVHLAAMARRLGLRTVFYVCPQYWAWAPWRVRRFAKSVDEALAIFPFEVDYFARYGLQVTHVGHPAADSFDRLPPENAGDENWTVALLPGSRSHEVHSHWPWLLDAARGLRERFGDKLRFVSTHLRERHREHLRHRSEDASIAVEVRDCSLPVLLQTARLSLVGSGTATLECALSGVPSCVVYRVSRSALFLSRFLVTSPFIAQPNLLSGREVFPEFLRAVNPGVELVDTAAKLLADGPPRQSCLESLAELRRAHLRPGTADRAAERVLAHLQSSPPRS